MNRLLTALIVALVMALLPAVASARDARKIDREVRAALDDLYEAQPATRNVLARASGVLVFPAVYKGAIGIGGEYGEGSLLERGRTTGYYNLASASIGFALGGQKRIQVIAFMDPAALARFKASDGWEAGVDGSVVVAEYGTSAQADTKQVNQPILGFILGEKGLMYNVSLEGSKITPIDR
jgi:lipid-binding SYLF domain-containing protein